MAGKLVSSLGLVALAGAVAFDAPQSRRGCLVSDEGAVQQVARSTLPRQSAADLPSNFTVDVHFHLASTEEDENLITDAIVDAQWKVLHDAFARFDINLNLASVDRVVDNKTGQAFLVYEGPEKGYTYYAEELQDYMVSTRKGGYDELNLYFYSKYSPGATGYCVWPTTLADDDVVGHGIDACQLSAMTMPGFTLEQGAFEEWHMGHLAVHEAGHWFGLNHTFAGSCGQTGDFVADTPSQRWEVYGCPIGSDTCPDSPGLDPIHNYMGYTQDNCTNEFTPGQKTRMFETFFGYRRKI
ncbi:metalloprotease [Plectosphaerella plurivora]|uniref:Metalloprotease n=1 Tax=Plectosphaerella plurivora TaxID=936078 RepID=A0A9P9AB02_9PEZI|nr:metalloprotease [Plectosphaerella plurivora]